MLLDDEEEIISRLTFKRELWVRPLLMNRENYGAFYTTFQEALEMNIVMASWCTITSPRNEELHHHYTRITHQN